MIANYEMAACGLDLALRPFALRGRKALDEESINHFTPAIATIPFSTQHPNQRAFLESWANEVHTSGSWSIDFKLTCSLRGDKHLRILHFPRRFALRN